MQPSDLATAILEGRNLGKKTKRPAPRANKHSPQSREDFTPNLAARIQMLPTPTDSMVTMQDMVQAKFHSSKRPKYGEANLIPTPATRDYRGANGLDHMEKDRPHMDQLPNVIAHGTNRGVKLQPAFVEWMQGYPIGYTDLEV